MINSQPNRLLDALLKSVWRRQQFLHQAGGLLAFIRWGLLFFLLGMTVDWLFDLPSAARVVILGVLLSVALVGSWRAGWSQLRRFNASYSALLVEKHHGGLASLLVSAVQLANPGSAAGASESLREKTCRAAEEAANSLKSHETVSYRGLRRPGLLALGPVMLIACMAVINLSLLSAGFGRIFTPWRIVAYPTKTQIVIEGGDRIVKEGESLRLIATLAGEVPDKATIILRTGSGDPRERSLPVTDQSCAYSIDAVFRSFEYRISAGDARSDWHVVRVISAPRIERAEVSLAFPDYTQRPIETVDALTMTVPEGTRIKWTLALDRAVVGAEFRPAGTEPQSMEISADGRVVTIEQLATGSRSYSFGWVDRDHHFDFSSPTHFLQVSPDQAPRVELTSPDRNLFATLGRKIDLAYRCRDDHGIGEAAIAYRVNKTGEIKAPLALSQQSDAGEQRVDWNDLEDLAELKVGDNVSFVIEVADRYPGQQGPHRVRSEPRSVRFVTTEEYLSRIELEKRRLLSQVRRIYLEEREVHDLVRSLDPAADSFLQTCQLEAVRQDLIRDRLHAVRKGIDTLVADIAANQLEVEADSAALVMLGEQLQVIADDQVGRAASLLRDLAVTTASGGTERNPLAAVDRVNRSARELGLVVFRLGFAEGADAMSRELHATVQTQVALRQRMLVAGKTDKAADEQTAKAQAQLAQETARLLAAAPRNQESTRTDALVAFKLSRMVNGLVRSGTIDKMSQSAVLMARGEGEQAARLQSEVISALLEAEFRLRFGAEYEVMTKARELLGEYAVAQRTLREELASLSEKPFIGKQSAIADSQTKLHQRFHLILMPTVPPGRPRLFDTVLPPAPPVDELLAQAGSGLKQAVAAIKSGDREAAVMHQQLAEVALFSLADIASQRIEAMTEVAGIRVSVVISSKQAAQIKALEDRLLSLLEQVEDAADDKVNTAFLAPANQALAQDAGVLLRNIGPSEDNLPMIGQFSLIVRTLEKATALLKENDPDAAIESQEQALDALQEAGRVIEELTQTQTALSDVLKISEEALTPGPLLAEIEAEQAVLYAATQAAKDEATGRPEWVIAQKNLIHAVNAVLDSLDPLAHKIESGTVLLFAKADMQAAAIGLETGDLDEALDAQSFIVESLQELQANLDEATPSYRYVRELAEQLYELKSQSAAILAGTRQWHEQAEAAADSEGLKRQVQGFASLLTRLSGEERHAATADRLAQVIGNKLDEGALAQSLSELRAQASELELLIKNLAYFIAPPVAAGGYAPQPAPEIVLLETVLNLAAHQQDLSRSTQAAVQAQWPAAVQRQRELADQLAAAGSHPKLAAAQAHMLAAATALTTGDHAAAMNSQQQANDALRHFVYAYVLKYVMIPPPGPPLPPAPPTEVDELVEQSILPLFEPGALTGDKPKGGSPEWEVLGRRDRAALNENFARELPLEYREILKDYYERLTHER